MCDKVTQETGTSPIPEKEYVNLYVPNGRQDVENCIKALRSRADMLESLLKSIPESITNETKQGLQFVASLVWKTF